MKPEDDASTARRQFVGGMTTGLAAAFVYPAFAQQGQQESCPGSLQRPSQSRKQDPRTQYPIPPFPPQKQEPPGLVSKMIPRPDHGETTYKGSGRLVGRKALVTGGDSGIGRAAAIAFAREGADVAINYLPVEESDAREVVKLIPGLARRLRWGVPANRRNSVPCMSFSRRRNQATQPDRCTVLQAGKGTLAQLTRPEAERSPSFDSPIY